MFVIPAIDIIEGKCVRLTQGKFNKKKVYRLDPVETAKGFEKEGAKILHIVDLEGAKSGEPLNEETVFAIVRAVKIPAQVGGGIRSYDQARKYLENGVRKIILSTIAVENPKLLERLVKEFGNSRVVVSVDVRNNKLAIDGWTKQGGKFVANIISFLKKRGIKNVIATDISRDGLLKGPNFDLAKRFVRGGFKVIAAGGVSSLSDVQEFNKLGVYGVIVGKALYEGRINLQEAQSSVEYKNCLVKRIIPCLDVKAGRVVKGVYFRNLRDAGDPVELGKLYCELGADELVFLDIAATLENRKTLFALVERIAREINIPFTVGGGISRLEDIKILLGAGADKVSICSAAIQNPALIKRAAKYFGSQCIVISVDAKRKNKGWKIYIKGGTEATNVDALKFSEQMERLGAGELLVNSLDRDGAKKGFDIALLKAVSQAVNIPVIASSGAGSMKDFLEVFQKTNADAALGASVFHYKEVDIRKLKKFLSKNDVSVRL